MKKLVVATALMATSLFAESFANLELTSSTIFINAQAPLSKTEPVYARGGYLIFNKDNDTNKNKNNFGYIGIKTEGQLLGDEAGTTGALFIDGVYTKDNSAIPIGIGTSTYLNFNVPTFFRWEIEYAPKVLSFKNANRFLKGHIEIGERFIRNAEAFVGYRTIAFDHLYHNAVYAGVGFVF